MNETFAAKVLAEQLLAIAGKVSALTAPPKDFDERKACLTIFNTVAQLMPQDPESWNRIGVLLLDSGKFKAAEPYLSRALEMDPHNPVILYNRALCAFELKDTKRALHWFMSMTGKQFDDMNDWHHHVGACYYELGNYAAAERQWLLAIEAPDEKSFSTYFRLSRLYEITDQPASALRYAKEAYKNANNKPNRLAADALVGHLSRHPQCQPAA
ncbi:MAG: tetratricopeptide repeat protein [Alphaproteobacteria bacterium]|nr:tetratricopeptide repeat protein [Alphaproteobacteria bacterium]